MRLIDYYGDMMKKMNEIKEMNNSFFSERCEEVSKKFKLIDEKSKDVSDIGE